MSGNENLNIEDLIGSYNIVLKQLYDNVYGEDIKEVPLSSGEYIIANRTELGLIYQKLATFEEYLEMTRKKVIEQTKKEAEEIIQQAKLKSFAIYDDCIGDGFNDLELVRTVKDLASENLIYLYKKIKKQNEINIETLIQIDRDVNNNLDELEEYADVYNLRKTKKRKRARSF